MSTRYTAPACVTRTLVVAAVIVGTIAAVASLANPAMAQAPTDADLKRAEALATEAKVYFRTKLYSKAADKFMEAFGISRRPALVYNAARAFEEAGKLGEAIAMFQHYRTLKGVDAAGKQAATKRMETLQKKKKAADAKAKAEAAAKAKATAEAKRKEAAKREAARKAAGKAKSSGSGSTSGSVKKYVAKRPFPLVRGVGAGVALLFSVAAYVNASRIATEIPQEDVIDQKTKKQYLDNADSARTWRGIAVGVAVVGVGVGAWAAYDYFLKGDDKASSKGKNSVRATPWLPTRGNGMGLGVEVAF